MQPDTPDAAAEIARLSRRLERERATRLQAESISEKGLRDLYEQQQQLQFLTRIAVAANQTTSVTEVLQFAVSQVCEFTNWEVGHCYVTAGAGETLRLQSTPVWHTAHPGRIAEFQRVTQEMNFSPGIGLPGRVLANGKPLWVLDVTDDSNFPRRPLAFECGLRGASAFPVLSGQEVVAVLEFFSSVAREPDETLLELMAQIGLQLGRVIERQRADDRLRDWTQTLKDNEARFRDFAESASDWFWEQDETLRFTYISRGSLEDGGEHVLGKTRVELRMEGHHYALDEEQWRLHDELVQARRPYQNLRLQRLAADGSLRHISVSGRPVFDGAGKFLGYRGAGRDVTSEVEVELELARRIEERTAELRQAQSELLRSERLSALGQLTATVAHELRNPLSAIKNTIFSIREMTNAKGLALDRPFARMDRSIARCDDIISELLEYSRTHRLNCRRQSLDKWLHEVVGEQTPPPGVQVAFDLTAAGAHVNVDSDRFRRVVINLFENAVHAMIEAKEVCPQPMLVLRTRVVADQLEIVIEDNGPGIPPENLARVFEPLFSTKSFGTGLGLPIVKQIVEQHGGSIELASTLGTGTRVRVRLPLAEEAVAAA